METCHRWVWQYGGHYMENGLCSNLLSAGVWSPFPSFGEHGQVSTNTVELAVVMILTNTASREIQAKTEGSFSIEYSLLPQHFDWDEEEVPSSPVYRHSQFQLQLSNMQVLAHADTSSCLHAGTSTH